MIRIALFNFQCPLANKNREMVARRNIVWTLGYHNDVLLSNPTAVLDIVKKIRCKVDMPITLMKFLSKSMGGEMLIAVSTCTVLKPCLLCGRWVIRENIYFPWVLLVWVREMPSHWTHWDCINRPSFPTLISRRRLGGLDELLSCATLISARVETISNFAVCVCSTPPVTIRNLWFVRFETNVN